MENRVSSPSAFKTANKSICLTVLWNRAYFQGLRWFYSYMSTTHDQTPSQHPIPTPDDVRGVLAGVLDPELRASIIELGMVHDVRVEPNGDVMVKVALTTAACPLRGQIGTDVRSKVAGLPGVGEVNVESVS